MSYTQINVEKVDLVLSEINKIFEDEKVSPAEGAAIGGMIITNSALVSMRGHDGKMFNT